MWYTEILAEAVRDNFIFVFGSISSPTESECFQEDMDKTQAIIRDKVENQIPKDVSMLMRSWTIFFSWMNW